MLISCYGTVKQTFFSSLLLALITFQHEPRTKLSQPAIHSHRHALSIFCIENTEINRTLRDFLPCPSLLKNRKYQKDPPIPQTRWLCISSNECTNFCLVYSKRHLMRSFLRLLSAGTERPQWQWIVVFHQTHLLENRCSYKEDLPPTHHPLCGRALLAHPQPVLHGLGGTSWQILLTTH